MTVEDDFVAPNDPILKKISNEVPLEKITSLEIKNDVERMLEVAYGHQVDRQKPFLVGVSAPQLGISKRIILVDVAAKGKGGEVGDLRVYIDPDIYWYSEEEEEWYEGCWSADRVTGIVSRPKVIRVRSYTTEGVMVDEQYEGYTARIFQHEIDHLFGLEFVSRITDYNNLHWVEDDQWSEYRHNEGWRNWSKKCPIEKWYEIKGIVVHKTP